MTKDCAECEGEGLVEEMCGNCGVNGERFPGRRCSSFKGVGEFLWECEALGCESGQVAVETEEDLEEDVGMSVIS